MTEEKSIQIQRDLLTDLIDVYEQEVMKLDSPYAKLICARVLSNSIKILDGKLEG